MAAKPLREEIATATWYEVAPDSIPALRAFPGEWTAAHDELPIGTYVRVTNLSNDRSTLVRITDRGIGDDGIIDLCAGAAKEIGLIGKGITKVRLGIMKVEDENAPVATASVAF
jgi:rare lipoprotein A